MGGGRRNAQAYSFEGCGRGATDKWRICCVSQQQSVGALELDGRAARVAIPRLLAMAGKAAPPWTIAFGRWLPFYPQIGVYIMWRSKLRAKWIALIGVFGVGALAAVTAAWFGQGRGYPAKPAPVVGPFPAGGAGGGG